MHAERARLDDPGAPPNGFRDENLHLRQAQRRILRKTQDGDSGGLVRRESQNIGKVDVKSQKASVLAEQTSNRVSSLARLSSFLQDRLGVMTCFEKKVDCPGTQVLVQFPFHAALLPGKSTNRSRLISAP